MRKAITDVAPQSLVLLRGSDAARRELQAHAHKELQGFGTRVLLPGRLWGLCGTVLLPRRGVWHGDVHVFVQL